LTGEIMNKIIILLVVFLVLTLVAGMHIYQSFKRLSELPERLSALNEKLPEGFWLDFGMVYYYSPVKMIILACAIYSACFFLVDYVWKRFR